MRRGLLVVTVSTLALVACTGVEPLSEPVREVVEVESVDLPGRLWDPFMPSLAEGQEVVVTGNLTIPATDAPVPAVIITHGCGGISGAERGWVDDLTDQGYASLLLDSFEGRGISSICAGRQTVNVGSMLIDLFRAADALDANPYIDGSKIAVLGFSFGGRTALWSAMTRFVDLYEGRPLSAHIAVYPSTCFIRLADETEITGAPIRILHGTEDNWTPIDQCRDYIDRLAAGGADARLIAYDGAHHGFDNETLPPSGTGRIDAPSPRNCTFIEVDGAIIDSDTGEVAGVGSDCVELGVDFGYNPAAHKAAKSDLWDILAQAFGS